MTELYFLHGLNINAADPSAHGFTALHFAAQSGNTAVVQQLLEYGVDASRKDWFGKTAVEVAQECGHYHLSMMIAEGTGPKVSVVAKGVAAANEIIEAANKKADELIQKEHEEKQQAPPTGEPELEESEEDPDAPSPTKSGLPTRFLPPADDDLRGFLRELGLGCYVPNFHSQAILRLSDLQACCLTSKHLKEELGITKLLHRKKILTALAALEGLEAPCEGDEEEEEDE